MITQTNAPVIAALLAAALALTGIVTNIVLDARQYKRAQLLEAIRVEAAREQETVNWLRLQLHTQTVVFLNAAFDIAGISRDLGGVSDYPSGRAPELLKEQLDRAHQQLKEAQTALRLLAPAELMESIEDCHFAHDDLIDLASSDIKHKDEDWQKAKATAKEARAAFVTRARVPVGLDPMNIASVIMGATPVP